MTDLGSAIQSDTVMVPNSAGDMDLPVFPLVEPFGHRSVHHRSEGRVTIERDLELSTMGMSAEHEVPIISLKRLLGIGVMAKEDAHFGLVWFLRVERTQASFRFA